MKTIMKNGWLARVGLDGREAPLHPADLGPATEEEAKAAVRTLLRYIGEDPEREGLRETPRRVIAAWDERAAGYRQNPEALLATDFDGDGYDEMIVVPHVEFWSVCEHHMIGFNGEASVGYVPKKRIVGLSKLARVVDVFARRLQVQERLTKQIADAVRAVLDPRGVGVVIRARHGCMGCRGVMKQRAEMVTCTLYGVFRRPEVRAEFMAHCR